jgi:acetyltransferase-like isoleucine patch superfamily enzyme
MHSIIDVASGERVNPARNVIIEERVWVAERAIILKGSHIEAGSIIGAGSVVSGHIPPNSLAVGIPAKVIRSGVTWNHKLL